MLLIGLLNCFTFRLHHVFHVFGFSLASMDIILLILEMDDGASTGAYSTPLKFEREICLCHFPVETDSSTCILFTHQNHSKDMDADARLLSDGGEFSKETRSTISCGF